MTLTSSKMRLTLVESAGPSSVVAQPVADVQADLVWWFDASDPLANGGASLPADGSNLTRWHDKSDTDLDFVSPAVPYASGPPSWHAGSGAPYVHFEWGENLPMENTLPSGAFPPLYALSATAGTFFLVVRNFEDPPTYKTAGPVGAIGTQEDNFYPLAGDLHIGTAGDYRIRENFGSNVMHATEEATIDLAQVHVYTVVAAANDIRTYLNGTLIWSSTSNTVLWNSDRGQYRPRMAIQYGDSGSHRWAGDIFEWRCYSRALTDAERAQLHDFLANKWGIA